MGFNEFEVILIAYLISRFSDIDVVVRGSWSRGYDTLSTLL